MAHRCGPIIIFTFVARVAFANSFGSLEEVPIASGELRFVAPKLITTGSSTRTEVGFPLEKTTLRGSITGAVAGLELEQVFSNPYREPIEAVYLFPLGARAAVHDYEMVIGERTVRGTIDTKAKARATYETAKMNGQTAGLVEQERPNVFQQRLANIPPGQRVVVRLRYAELIEPHENQFEFVFPMVVAPRYQSSSGPALSDPSRTTNSGPTVDLDLLVDTVVPTTQLSSPSHQLSRQTIDTFQSRVTLSNITPSRDFVLRFTGAAERTGAGLVTHRQGDDGYFLLMLQPKSEFRPAEIRRRDVVLIIDTSCSMSGEPLRAAALVGQSILGTLRPTDSFSMIAFATGTQRFAPTALPASASNLEAATQWLLQLSASGGTELAAGISDALEPQPDDRIRAVYLMTDGLLSNEDEVVSVIRRTSTFNRIYPVGIGSAPNRSLLGSLGEVGRGFTRYVQRLEEAEPVARELVERSTQPYLTDVRIDWHGLDVQQLEPPVLPDLHVGQPIVLTGRYRKPGRETVTITGRVGDAVVKLPMDVTLAEVAERPAISKLWARRRIARLELDDETGAQEGAITDLGLGHHLLTKYTSFVAVDERRSVSAGKTRTVVQPLLVPDGMQPRSVEPQAPPFARSPSAPYAPGPSSGPTIRFGGGGGGDLDPFTIATLASFGPLAWALRKRRAARRERQS